MPKSLSHESKAEPTPDPSAVERAAPEMLQALREVVGAHAEAGNCFYCLMDAGMPHEDDCTMQFVLDAIKKAEGRA